MMMLLRRRRRLPVLPLRQDWTLLLAGLLTGKWVKIGLRQKASQPTSTCCSWASLLLRLLRQSGCLDRHLAP